MSKPTLERIIDSRSRVPKKPEWPKGDIQKALRNRKDWKGLPVVVWVNFGTGKRVNQFSISGTLEAIEDKGRWLEYLVEIDGRAASVRCRDYHIFELAENTGLKQNLIESYDELFLKKLDAESTSPESFERNRERVLDRTKDEETRNFISHAAYPSPPHRANKDPARQFKVMHEITIAYLEGNKRNREGAFSVAAGQLGLTAGAVRNDYEDWLRQCERG